MKHSGHLRLLKMEMPSVLLLIFEETGTQLNVNRILLSGLVQAVPTVAGARSIQVGPRSPQLTLRTDPYMSWLSLLDNLKQSPLSLDSGQIPVLLCESLRRPSHLAQLLRQATIWIGIDFQQIKLCPLWLTIRKAGVLENVPGSFRSSLERCRTGLREAYALYWLSHVRILQPLCTLLQKISQKTGLREL